MNIFDLLYCMYSILVSMSFGCSWGGGGVSLVVLKGHNIFCKSSIFVDVLYIGCILSFDNNKCYLVFLKASAA